MIFIDNIDIAGQLELYLQSWFSLKLQKSKVTYIDILGKFNG